MVVAVSLAIFISVDASAQNATGVVGQGGTKAGTIARPKNEIHGCTVAQLQTTDPIVGAGIDACLDKMVQDAVNNKPLHFVSCTGSKVECCFKPQSNVSICTPVSLMGGTATTKPPTTGGVIR